MTLLSNRNEREIEVDSKKLQASMRKQGKKNVKKKIPIRGMRFARVNGNCCWKVRERYLGGESEELWNPHTYYLPWSIRSIKIIDC